MPNNISLDLACIVLAASKYPETLPPLTYAAVFGKTPPDDIDRLALQIDLRQWVRKWKYEN